MQTSSFRNWLPIAVLVGVGLLLGVIAIVALGPTLLSAALGLEPVPTAAPTLPPLTETLTPVRPTATLPPITGSLSGRVWQDRCPPGGESTEACALDEAGRIRGNGVIDAGEPGFSGVTVRLGAGQCPASGQAETVTAPDGSFRFDNLSPGLYCLSVDPAANAALDSGAWTFPAASDQQGRASQTVNVVAGVLAEGLDFGWDDSLPPTPTNTATPTITPTPTISPTATNTLRPSATRTRTALPGPTITRTRTATPTWTITRTPTISPTPTISRTPTATASRTGTATSTGTRTATVTATGTATGTATATATATATGTATATATLPPPFGVVIQPTAATGFGDPGQIVTYTLTVSNTGTTTDSFTVTLGTTFTAVAAPDPILSLGGGLSATLTVSVTAPSNALAGVVGTTVVTVTSQGNSTLFASATLSTTVNQVGGVAASADTTGITAPAGSVVTYTVSMTNTGNATDGYTVTVNTAGTYVTTISLTSVTGLAPGGAVPILVQVDIPPAATPGDTHSVQLTFISLFDDSQTTAVTLVTTVGPAGPASLPKRRALREEVRSAQVLSVATRRFQPPR